MKKFLKKKTAAGVLTVGLLMTGSTVYASSALNVNLLTLIQDGIGHVSDYFEGEAKKEVRSASEAKKKEIGGYVDTRTDQVISDMEKTKKGEVDRAKKEIDTHYKDLVTQAESAIADETKKGNEEIKKAVDAELSKAKNDLTAEFETKLKEKMTKMKSNNGIGYGSGN